MAGSPCPIDLMRQVTSRMHLSELTIAYGLTEASPVVTQTETIEPLEVRTSTVGRVLPGVEVRLIDPVTGQDVPEGSPGELWTRGHGVMIGYYRDLSLGAGLLGPPGRAAPDGLGNAAGKYRRPRLPYRDDR
jgi:fatty-acyl-CoA synthase